MPPPFLTDDAKAALSAAAREIEAKSCAEVVISVRPSSGAYLQADLAVGIATGASVIALLLFLPRAFGLVWFLVDPLIVGALAALVSSWSPGLRRALTPAGVRRRWVERAARSRFVERRVHGTAGRSGILVYISRLEREAALVADLGVEAAVALSPAWASAVAELEAAVRRGEDGVRVSRCIRELAPPLAEALPRPVDDVNELADEVDVQ